MEIKIIKGTSQIGGCITEIKSKNTRILIDFGNDLEDTKVINDGKKNKIEIKNPIAEPKAYTRL